MNAVSSTGHAGDSLVLKAVIAGAFFMAGYLAGESNQLAPPTHQVQKVAQAKG